MIADASVRSDASARERPGPPTAVRKKSADAGPKRPNTSHTSGVKTEGGSAAVTRDAYLRILRASRSTAATVTEVCAATSATRPSVTTDATAASLHTAPPVHTRTARTSGRSVSVPAENRDEVTSSSTSRHCGWARSASAARATRALWRNVRPEMQGEAQHAAKKWTPNASTTVPHAQRRLAAAGATGGTPGHSRTARRTARPPMTPAGRPGDGSADSQSLVPEP